MKNKLPEGWKENELGDVFDFQSKTGKFAGTGLETGKYKFFTSSGIQKAFTNEHDFEGEHLIFATGGKAGLHYCNEKFSTSNDCFVVKVSNSVFTKYVYYFLRAKIHLLEEGFKGAGLKHISKRYIQKLKIIYPKDKQIQKSIIAILENVEQAKEWRKEADGLTKKFLKSVFREMFGDVGNNTEQWETETLRGIAERISDGPFGSNLKTEHYTKEGIRVIRLQNIGIGEFLDEDKVFISPSHHEILKKHTCIPGDVLIGTLGDPNIRACIMPKSIKESINKADCIQLRPNKKKVISEYVAFLINSPEILTIASSMLHGQTRTRISMGQVASLKVPIPPLPLQQKFASIVQEVESMKEQQKHSKEHLDNLFNVLMQKSFKGELI